jgi:DNA repair protein RecN (Recombination protein N)
VLQKLSIENYAIIDKLEINFSGQLNVITGETGAGKSIIVGALHLILGERADSSVLVNKEKKCVVEGSFDVKNKNRIKEFLEAQELDTDDELVLRREIGVNGKSRAFINDTPVNLNQIQRLSTLLVDLHQQFDTLELGQSDFQREVLDALARNSELLQQYQGLYTEWQQLKKAIELLKAQKQQFDKEADYNQFQFNELEEASFQPHELEEIDAELKLLNNSEGIKETLDKVNFALKGSDTPIAQQVKILYQQLQGYAEMHPSLPSLLERLQAAQIELSDIADELDSISDHINYDPKKIEQLNERLAMGYRLMKKHAVKSTDELIDLKNQFYNKLQAVLDIDDAITQKENEAAKLFNNAEKISNTVSEKRKKQVKPLEEKVNKLLARVGMPNAKLKVAVEKKELNYYGNDSIEFLFNANIPAGQHSGGEFQPLKKVASGGELSRLMLCIKSLVADSIDLPTMIFDEIDTGISGEAARQVGIIMKELAMQRQVISITHQPQIAGKATSHFFVYKEIVKNSVQTNIRQLTTEERITAIAKMLSGEKPTAAAMENAREMLMN